MRSWFGRQNDARAPFENRDNPLLRKIYIESKGRGRWLESEVIDPAGILMTMRGLDLIVGMRFGIVVFQEVGVHQSAAMIVVIMGVKQWRGRQSDKHGNHTETCAKPLHAADSLAPSAGKSIESPPAHSNENDFQFHIDSTQ